MQLDVSYRRHENHQAPRKFKTTMSMNSRLARWHNMLSGFAFQIQYRRGKDMITDLLTRRSQDGRSGDGLRDATRLGPCYWSKEAWAYLESVRGIKEVREFPMLRQQIADSIRGTCGHSIKEANSHLVFTSFLSSPACSF